MKFKQGDKVTVYDKYNHVSDAVFEEYSTIPVYDKKSDGMVDRPCIVVTIHRADWNMDVRTVLEEKQDRAIRLENTISRIILLMANTLFKIITSAFKGFIAKSRDLIPFFIRSKRSKVILMRIILAGFAIGLVILMINTFEHLIKPDTAVTKDDQLLVVPVVRDRFTIQVAAYLKSEHAEKYVARLKSQGLDAYWTAAQGAKTKWYQVRLSHFAEKAAARAYGESLKAKGIIDDFYVANYRRP